MINKNKLKANKKIHKGGMSVKLRKKKLANGKKSLYLDIYHNGQRHYDFLRLILLNEIKVKSENNREMVLLSKRIKEANREKLILAETIRANRESELEFADHDIIPSFKRNADFVEYFQKIGESKGRSALIWKSVLIHLKKFSGGAVPFKNINELWLEGFQNY